MVGLVLVLVFMRGMGIIAEKHPGRTEKREDAGEEKRRRSEVEGEGREEEVDVKERAVLP